MLHVLRLLLLVMNSRNGFLGVLARFQSFYKYYALATHITFETSFHSFSKMVFGVRSKKDQDGAASSGSIKSEAKRLRRSYLPLERVMKIFPSISVQSLCAVAEAQTYVPSRILKLVPEASTKQLCSLFLLIEEYSKQDEKSTDEVNESVENSIKEKSVSEMQRNESMQKLTFRKMKNSTEQNISCSQPPAGTSNINWKLKFKKEEALGKKRVIKIEKQEKKIEDLEKKIASATEKANVLIEILNK